MSPTGIYIDCSVQNGQMESILEWVAGHPRNSAIHIALPSVLSGSIPRKYQTSLQALGCTVTAKLQYR
jgi:hypothetical protein